VLSLLGGLCCCAMLLSHVVPGQGMPADIAAEIEAARVSSEQRARQ
jgi:hypothetical protein